MSSKLDVKSRVYYERLGENDINSSRQIDRRKRFRRVVADGIKLDKKKLNKKKKYYTLLYKSRVYYKNNNIILLSLSFRRR